jgi:hypothetical protein
MSAGHGQSCASDEHEDEKSDGKSLGGAVGAEDANHAEDAGCQGDERCGKGVGVIIRPADRIDDIYVRTDNGGNGEGAAGYAASQKPAAWFYR